jgi:rRNA maturation endonuclease Nob1
MSETPKSALELVMERLRKKDADAGIAETPLTDDQRAAIAEARSVYEAKVAERRILHQSATVRTLDPEERQALDDGFRRDLERFESDRESKVRKIREKGPV